MGTRDFGRMILWSGLPGYHVRKRKGLYELTGQLIIKIEPASGEGNSITIAAASVKYI